MRRRLSILLSAGLVTAALATGGTAAAVPAKGAHGSAKGGAEKSAHDRVVAYWTPARRASAIPRDVVLPATRAKGGKPGKPGHGGGGGGGGTTDVVTGATWTDPTAPVAHTTGKVYFEMGGVAYVCSGSAIAGSVNLVLTAGHCVWDDADGFATRWTFWPGYDSNGPSGELGTWTATSLFTTAGWHGPDGPQGNDFPNDAGLAVVTDGDGGSLKTRLVGQGELPTMGTGTNPNVSPFSAFGYPAAKKYHGETLTYCQGQVATTYDEYDTVSMACDMTGGSSGGPWYQGKNGSGPITSLNSYGYNGLNRMFGPTFDSQQEGVAFTQADDGSCDKADGDVCTAIPPAA